ncbi:MAG: hypothetical protein M0P69_19610, partial [Bacteroidales bacterium]|nr:hypothetical protein [Bacteroidales bacterium]
MGTTDTKPIENTADSAAAGQHPSANNSSPAADSGAGTRAGAGAGPGADPKPKRSHKKKPVVAADLVAKQPEIVNVNIPEPAPAAAAPKRSHKKKAPVPPDLGQLENNIEYVTAAGFGMIGLATKQPEIWEVRPDELQQISRPAARIVERAGQLETTNKYADYALLLGALAMVVLPRILITKAMKPQEGRHHAGTNDRSNPDPNREAARP